MTVLAENRARFQAALAAKLGQPYHVASLGETGWAANRFRVGLGLFATTAVSDDMLGVKGGVWYWFPPKVSEGSIPVTAPAPKQSAPPPSR